MVNSSIGTELNSKTQENSERIDSGILLGGIISIFNGKALGTAKTVKFTCSSNTRMSGLLLVDQNLLTDVYAIGRASGVATISKKSGYTSPSIENNVLSVPLTAWGRAVFLVISESNVKVE